MLTGLNHLHSANRYILLILLIVTIVTSYRKWKSGAEFTKQDDKLNLITFIVTHLQLLIGLALYFTSGRVQFGEETFSNFRFFTVEHLIGMLIAIVLITLSRIKGKKIKDGAKRHKLTFVYCSIALLIILVSIPWPFYNVGITEWF